MGATYTRQSTYTEGDVIQAADTNDEFDQLLAAFAASTGHTHDGTTGEGGPISTLAGHGITFGAGTSGTDITITFDGETNDGVLKWMEDEDYFEFSDDILIASTEKIQFRDTAIFINSSADGQLDLVADTEIQIAATTIDINGLVDISGNLSVGGNLDVTGTFDLSDANFTNAGDISLDSISGDADSNTSIAFSGSDVITVTTGGETQITFNNGSILPTTNNDVDLGSDSLEFKDLYLDGSAYIDGLGRDMTVATDKKILFRDSAIYLQSSADGQLDIVADTEVQIAATTVDINGLVDISGNLSVGGDLDVTGSFDMSDANITNIGSIALDTITNDGTDITLDSSGDIILDADGANVIFKDAGTSILDISNDSTDAVLTVSTADKNLTIKGTDGSSAITALDIDMALAGKATFNGDVVVGGDLTVSGDDLTMATNTSGHLLIADGTNFNPTGVGDLSEISTVANDDVFLAVDTSGGGLKKITRSTIVSGLATSSGLSNIVEDATPQLGGNLDTNSHNILIDDAHFIGDENGNEQIVFQTTSSAVNQIEVTNAATGNGVQIASTGGDTNIDLKLLPKGSGQVVIDGNVGIESGLIDLKNAGAVSKIKFYCESSNAHAQTLQGAPHSEAASNSLTLPSTGGDVDLVSTASTATLTNKTLTAPKIADGGFIADANGNELVVFQTTGSAVNQLEITNNASGSNPILAATGGDTNIGIALTPKGTGEIVIGAGNLNYGGTAVTATGAELNILDGVTSTAAELNILDGVTSTAAELNVLDGITAVVGELNALDLGSTAVGNAIASKAVILDSNKDFTGLRNVTATGAVTGGSAVFDGGVAIDNITIDGTEIDLSSGDLTVDVAGDIILDAGGGDLKFAVAGTEILSVTNSSSDVIIKPIVDAKDIIFQQRDGTEVARIEDNGTFNVVTSKLAINGTAVTSTAAELNILDGVTSTAAELNILDGVTSTAAELNALDGITAVVGELNALDLGSTAVGTAIASKAMILDSNKDYTGVRNFTLSGELDAGSLDVSGNVDIDGTLETDNLTVGGAQGNDGQVLTSTGSGVGWENAAAGGAANIGELADGVTDTANTSVGLGTNALDSVQNNKQSVGIGFNSLTGQTSGSANVAVGYETMSGSDQVEGVVAIGYETMQHNTTNTTIGIGYRACYKNSGDDCIGIGYNALGKYEGTSGDKNVAIGYASLGKNTSGYQHTAVGWRALYNNTTGYRNTSFGEQSGYDITTGHSNTCFGWAAGYGLATNTNCIVIGNNAAASSTSVSNQITLGNGSIDSFRCQETSISGISDRRDKTNIQNLDAGLDFINSLRPVSFDWNMRDGGKVGQPDTGFIAQELAAAQETNDVVIPRLVTSATNANGDDTFEAAYAKLLPSMVLAIKELKAENDALKARVTALEDA